jgi:nucleoside-diphosphate-sugar epimerase
MGAHVVVGAGGIGKATAAALVAQGHTVKLVSRSGGGPAYPGLELVAADVTDAARLTELATGATSIVNAVNPPYTSWPRDWPPMAAAFLAAAERSGAGLVTVSNLYGYGLVDAPMREDQPFAPNGAKGAVRAQMWVDALAAHRDGRVRATELRASDYFGPGARSGMSYLGQSVIAPVSAGKRGWVPMGDLDAAHSWTYLPDIGTLAAALARSDPDGPAWGRAWHVPTSSARSMREVGQEVARFAGRRSARLSVLPWSLVRAGAVVVPLLREVRETAHQFQRPFVLDSTFTEATFTLAPTPWEDALAATVASLAS